jgi:hypothetical protein
MGCVSSRANSANIREVEAALALPTSTATL